MSGTCSALIAACRSVSACVGADAPALGFNWWPSSTRSRCATLRPRASTRPLPPPSDNASPPRRTENDLSIRDADAFRTPRGDRASSKPLTVCSRAIVAVRAAAGVNIAACGSLKVGSILRSVCALRPACRPLHDQRIRVTCLTRPLLAFRTCRIGSRICPTHQPALKSL